MCCVSGYDAHELIKCRLIRRVNKEELHVSAAVLGKLEGKGARANSICDVGCI